MFYKSDKIVSISVDSWLTSVSLLLPDLKKQTQFHSPFPCNTQSTIYTLQSKRPIHHAPPPVRSEKTNPISPGSTRYRLSAEDYLLSEKTNPITAPHCHCAEQSDKAISTPTTPGNAKQIEKTNPIPPSPTPIYPAKARKNSKIPKEIPRNTPDQPRLSCTCRKADRMKKQTQLPPPAGLCIIISRLKTLIC